MHLNSEYHILTPIKALPWQFISPTEQYGLEYHLTPDLSMRMEGIFSGEMAFNVGHILIGLSKMEVSELEFESVFQNEFMPAKSKERVTRACLHGQSSCFFNTPQMEYLQQLFQERNFICSTVSVWYKDRKVEDITQLPTKEFKLALDAMDELDVKRDIGIKENKAEIEEEYEKAIKNKAGVLGERNKKNAWEKIRNKKYLKKIGIGIGTVMLGITATLAKYKLERKNKPWALLSAIVLGTLGIILEIQGTQEVQNSLRTLNMD